VLKDTELQQDYAANIVFKKPGSSVVGYILTHKDQEIFNNMQEEIEKMDGYKENSKESMCFKSKVEVVLLDAYEKETNQTVDAITYHR
jgi:hypothetical protein